MQQLGPNEEVLSTLSNTGKPDSVRNQSPFVVLSNTNVGNPFVNWPFSNFGNPFIVYPVNSNPNNSPEETQGKEDENQENDDNNLGDEKERKIRSPQFHYPGLFRPNQFNNAGGGNQFNNAGGGNQLNNAGFGSQFNNVGGRRKRSVDEEIKTNTETIVNIDERNERSPQWG